MTLAALRADAACWDLHLLGRGVVSALDDDDDVRYYDVRDKDAERPLSVSDGVVVRRVDGCDDGTPEGPERQHLTSRISSSSLPPGCKAPLWLPATVQTTRETRQHAQVMLSDGSRSTVREAEQTIEKSLTDLKPESTLLVRWEEPLVCLRLPPPCSESPAKKTQLPAHIQGIVVGPKVELTLYRDTLGKLELKTMEGGPDGVEAIARDLYHEALEDIELVKSESDEKKEQPKKVVVFGRIFQPRAKTTDISWDAHCEAFALWAALQQWQRSTRRQPWRWRTISLEVEPVGSIPGGMLVAPRRSTGSVTSPASAVLTPRTRGQRRRLPEVDAAQRTEGLLALLHGFDADRSGTIDWPEFKECSRRLANLIGIPEQQWTEERARKEFDEIDANGNGMIEEEEWLAFADNALHVLEGADFEQFERVLYHLGENVSAIRGRLVSPIQGDVDVGLACKRGHLIRPLPIKQWGEVLAKSLHLEGGFRCAEIDDPAAFTASSRQRCTRCCAVDSWATFNVACPQCPSTSTCGWWCTKCVVELGRPRAADGAPVAVGVRHRQGDCKYCKEPAVLAWPDMDPKKPDEPLCNHHAASKLLEEAALCGVAGGREPPEGPSLAASVQLRLNHEFDEDDLPEAYAGFSRLLEGDLSRALRLEGTQPKEKGQFEVARIWEEPRPGQDLQCTVVEVTLLRAAGHPSPYELFLRLRSLAADREGPLYSSEYTTLSRLIEMPMLLEVVTTTGPEQLEMTTRVARCVAEGWPRLTDERAPGRTAMVARPQRLLLPSSAVVALRCLQPPENACGRLVAAALAYPAGAKQAAPAFDEFEELVCPERAVERARKQAEATEEATKTGRAPVKAKAEGKKAKTAGKKKVSVKAVSSCIVYLAPSPSGDAKALEGEGVLLALKPGSEYDIHAAVFLELEGGLEAPEPKQVASTFFQLRTSSDKDARPFGADTDGFVQVQTEEPDVAREMCFLDLIGIGGAPIVIDQGSCHVSCKPASESHAKVVKDYGVNVVLKEPLSGKDENPAAAGGLQLKVPTLVMSPLHTEVTAEICVSASADVVVQPCRKHRAPGWRPMALSVHARTTEAQCCKPRPKEDRCGECKWMKVKQERTVKIQVSLDIVRMAEIGDFVSVIKRSKVCREEDIREAIATVLSTRPHVPTEKIMDVFERAVGRKSFDVDFPVRRDGGTALHVAVEDHHIEAVRALLRRNCNPEKTNKVLETPLHAVARLGSSAAPIVAKALIDGVRVTWQGDEVRDAKLAEAKLKFLACQDVNGRTAVHLATVGDQRLFVAFLLDSGAPLDLPDHSGHAPLHAAAMAGSINCVAEFLSRPGATADLKVINGNGLSALHLASGRGHWDVASLLLAKKANPQQGANVDGKERHPLNFLADGMKQWGRLKTLSGVVDVAKSFCQTVVPKKIVADAGSALCDVALWVSGDVEVIETTEALLAVLDKAGLDRAQALGAAMVATIDAALRNGLVGDRRNEHRLAQAQAAGISFLEIPAAVDLALRLGASPDAVNANGDTALHLLLQFPARFRVLPYDQVSGQALAQTVYALLDRKANVHARNKLKQTPESLAKLLSSDGAEFGKAWQEVLSKGRSANLPAPFPVSPCRRMPLSPMAASVPAPVSGFGMTRTGSRRTLEIPPRTSNGGNPPAARTLMAPMTSVSSAQEAAAPRQLQPPQPPPPAPPQQPQQPPRPAATGSPQTTPRLSGQAALQSPRSPSSVSGMAPLPAVPQQRPSSREGMAVMTATRSKSNLNAKGADGLGGRGGKGALPPSHKVMSGGSGGPLRLPTLGLNR